MIKKQIALLALVVFFLSQFGKVINFACCKVAVYQQTNSFVCDCEKLLYTAVKADNTSKEQTPQHIAAHPSAEELFHPSDIPLTAAHLLLPPAEWPLYKNNKHFFLFENSIFHPPLHAA